MNIFSGSILEYLSFILFAAISIGLSLFLYNKNELPKFTKAILITLRAISLFLILSLLLNPFIEHFKNVSEEAKNIILIDKSFSSEIVSNDTAILNSVLDITKGGEDFKLYTFGSRIIQEEKELTKDSNVYNRYSTNLASSFDDIKDLNFEKINSISIVSDGLVNEGNNLLIAARNLKAPIHYKLIGDTSQRKDLVLNRVMYNKRQFIISTAKVFAEIKSFNTDKEVKINLFENDIKIRTNSILVSSSKYDYETVFDVISPIAGIKKYRMEIEPETGELTEINNSEIFYINYSDNKVSMLVLAGAPSYDLSSLKQTLNRSENIKYDTRVQKNASEYYEGVLPKFSDYDIITLIGFPNNFTSKESSDLVVSRIMKSRNAVFFFNSSDLSFDKISELKDILPFAINETGKREIKSNVFFTPNKLYDDTESLRRLKALPPAFFYQGVFTGRPNSTLLGLQNSEPAIVVDNSSEIKTAAFLGYGFYEWNLKPGGSHEYMQNVISGFITLCTDENSKDKFTVKTNKDCYAISEPVYFTSVIKEIDAANKYNVKLNISNRSKYFKLELSQTGENIFQGDMKYFEKGDYTVEADLYENDGIKYSTTTKFSVDEPFKEYKETRATDKILKEIANMTGGVNLSGKNEAGTESLFISKDGNTETFPYKSLFRNSIWYLIFILILLSIEWFIRKRNNLA
ncbi:MAG: hypothetical protein WC644_12615 [Ignavibacteria bacterium]